MLRNLSIWIATPIFIFPLAANARWMLPKEAGSVIEKYDIDYTVNKDGSFTQLIDYVVRVQGEDAKMNASLMQIDYNSFTDKVEILEAYTENDKKKIPVEPSAIEDRDKGEAKDYDAMKTRSIAFPQVEIGSRLHARYKFIVQKPQMPGRWSEEVALAPAVFIEKFHLKVHSEVPLFAELEDPRGLVTKKQRNKFSIEITNKRIIPGWVHAEKDPFFHPGGATYIRISTHKNWQEFFADLDKEYAKQLSAPLPKALKPWIAAAKKKSDPKQRILFLMERMSHDFRYFGDWRRHNGGIVPRQLAEIEKSRYGDCKDLASMLVALLHALNIEADVAFVRRGENAWGHEPDYFLPTISHFNHAIARAKVGGENLWLDATNPVSSLEPFPDIAGRPAWILQPNQGHFERLPEEQSSQFVHHHEFEYNFKSMDDVRVDVKASLKHLAPYHIASQLMMTSRSEVLSETLEYFTEGQEVRSFHYITAPETGRAIGDMKVALEYQSGRVTFDAGKAAFFVIPDGFLTGAFYETEDRESDIRLSEVPYLYQVVRRLKNTKLMQPKPDPCRVESDWMDIERKIEVEGKDVVIYQNVNLKKPYITKEEFRSSAFRKLQKGTRNCFYRSGVLIDSLTGAL